MDEALDQSDKIFNSLTISVIILFLFYIFAILASMDLMVFKPINRVAQGLRSKAFDIELPNIESANTLEVGTLIEAFLEMDKEVSQRQRALEHQAMHDHLTGLPNRFMLHQRMDYQLLTAEREQRSFSLLFMDLDYFKDVNDTLGHAAGDELLIALSERIKGLLRKSDTLARLGGDEFAILLPDGTQQQAGTLADKLIQLIHHPFEIAGRKINIAISIGIVTYPEDGICSDILLQHADIAMYSAKRQCSGYARYAAHGSIYHDNKLDIIHDLPEALEQQSLELYYQPKVSALTGAITGAEALLRWQHEKFGFIAPEQIIEAAERSGVLHKLSLFVLRKAIAQCCHWRSLGHSVSISVNLSVRDLSNKKLSQQVEALLHEHQLARGHLTLEITESVMMENLAISLEVLNKLHHLGVRLAIDDFGTGFSSLAYLKRLPVDELKIDKSFIIEIERDANDETIVKSTVSLGHNLGLNVVAEGVENAAVLRKVKELGCDELQGYHFGRPQPPAEFEQLLDCRH